MKHEKAATIFDLKDRECQATFAVIVGRNKNWEGRVCTGAVARTQQYTGLRLFVGVEDGSS
jgi:hypothetical protein